MVVRGQDAMNYKWSNTQRHLNNVCYIPNGSNRLISRGQLCKSGLVEKVDNKSTTFLLPTGYIFLRGFPRHKSDTLHWVQSMIAHPNVPSQLQNLVFENGTSI